MIQRIIFANKNYNDLALYIQKQQCKRMLLVHGASMNQMEIGNFFKQIPHDMGIEVFEFTDYQPNPCIESCIAGTRYCLEHDCDLIVACGGGSAIDVAKCIRLFRECDMKQDDFWLHLLPGKLPFIAIPTTAGTGSEATHFAVAYVNGKKISVAEKNNLPQAVVFLPESLKGLPAKQRAATYLDAFCHCIESLWSNKATVESRVYAMESLRILRGAETYLWEGGVEYYQAMLLAAHYAGCAINISQTTAAHAMCYKLTSMFNIPHGMSAGVCLLYVWEYMLEKLEQGVVIDKLEDIFNDIVAVLDVDDIRGGINFLRNMLVRCDCLPLPIHEYHNEMLAELVDSVNTQRMANHPLQLNKIDFGLLYERILKGRC